MEWLDLGARVLPILGFLVAITVVAELADRIGIFHALAYLAARLGRGSVLGLWLLVVAIATLATAVLSLDTTAVLLTPVVLALARLLSLNAALFAYTTVWLANTASLILPVSNLTNLLAVSRLVDTDPEVASVSGFALLMWPAATTAMVITVLLLAVLFRRSLRGRYERPRWRSVGDRVLFGVAATVCAALGPAFALGANVTLVAGVAALIMVGLCWARQPRLLSLRLVPWRLVIMVSVLFVLVQLGHELGLAGALAVVSGTGSSPVAQLQLAAVAAGTANLANNLPVFLALEPLADTPRRMAALLVGVNAGPLILPWGSLATLLWAARCRAAEIEVCWPQFIRRGLLLVPLVLIGCTAAMLVVHGQPA